MSKDAVIITQTVLGNTENTASVDPYGSMVVKGESFPLSPAGFGNNETGIYLDPIARELRGKPQEEIRSTILEAIEPLTAEKPGLKLVEQTLKGAFRDTPVGFVYGVTARTVSAQFQAYLTGLIKQAKKQKTSFVLITPSGFEPDLFPPRIRNQIVTVTDPSQIPKKPEKGKIYVVRCEPLPKAAFIGLIAYSEIPPIVAGDGAMSEALVLGKPFVMTRVRWNARNIANLATRLKENAQSKKEGNLYDAVFGDSLDLKRSLELQQYPESFASLAKELPLLTDQLVDTALAGKALNGKTQVGDVLAMTQDPALRFQLLIHLAELGDEQAIRWLKNYARANPADAFLAFKSGSMRPIEGFDAELLKLVERRMADPRIGEEEFETIAAGLKAATDRSAEEKLVLLALEHSSEEIRRRVLSIVSLNKS